MPLCISSFALFQAHFLCPNCFLSMHHKHTCYLWAVIHKKGQWYICLRNKGINLWINGSGNPSFYPTWCFCHTRVVQQEELFLEIKSISHYSSLLFLWIPLGKHSKVWIISGLSETHESQDWDRNIKWTRYLIMTEGLLFPSPIHKLKTETLSKTMMKTKARISH